MRLLRATRSAPSDQTPPPLFGAAELSRMSLLVSVCEPDSRYTEPPRPPAAVVEEGVVREDAAVDLVDPGGAGLVVGAVVAEAVALQAQALHGVDGDRPARARGVAGEVAVADLQLAADVHRDGAAVVARFVVLEQALGEDDRRVRILRPLQRRTPPCWAASLSRNWVRSTTRLDSSST
jgi:hypothetical protein